jgi:hypothetical protein
VLKLPKPTEFMAGMGNENTFFCQLPDSAFRAHLAPNLSPTILVTKVFFFSVTFFYQRTPENTVTAKSRKSWEFFIRVYSNEN